eukprot:1149854-Prorocentrum_minimum.AAC.1
MRGGDVRHEACDLADPQNAHTTAVVALRARQKTRDTLKRLERIRPHRLSRRAGSRLARHVALVGPASRFPAVHPNPAVTRKGATTRDS